MPLLCLLPALQITSGMDPGVKDTDPSSAARLHHTIMNPSPPLPSPPMMADDIVGLAAIAAALHYQQKLHCHRCQLYKLPYEYRQFEFSLKSWGPTKTQQILW